MKVNFDKICYGCFEERGDNKICPHCGYNSEEEKPYLALPPGTLLNGKYMIGKVLGIGGFGITYVGFDLQLQMKVAIKEYMPTGLATRHSDGFTVVLTRKVVKEYESGMESFLEEARILAKLQNTPNIVNVQNFFKENCTAYIVMEYIEGVSFKEYLKQKGGKVPYEDAMRILRPIMSALTEVHKFKLLHRDISPDNITITPAGDSKLLDFGAARFASSDDKSISVILKHGYAPEEQYSTHGKQGAWTDVYAMGATLYRAITGVLPPESVERRYNDTIKKPSAMGAEIPINSENAIMKALSINAEDRFQTMKDFMTELDREKAPEKEPVFSSLTAYNTSHTPPDDNATTVGGRTVADKSPTPTEEDKSAPADSSYAADKAAETKKMIIVGIVGALCIIGIIIGSVVSATAKENKNSSTNSYTTGAATNSTSSDGIEWLTYNIDGGPTFNYPSDSEIQWDDDGNFYLYDGLISGAVYNVATAYNVAIGEYYPIYDMEDLLAVIDNTGVQENLIAIACNYLSLQNCSQNEDISYRLDKKDNGTLLISVTTKNENGVPVYCGIYITPLSSESPCGVGCFALTVNKLSYENNNTSKSIFDTILGSYDSSSVVSTYSVISSSEAKVKMICIGSNLPKCSYGETDSGELFFADSNGNRIVWCGYIPNCTAEDRYSRYEYFETYGGLTWYLIVDCGGINGTNDSYNRFFTEYDGGLMYVDQRNFTDDTDSTYLSIYVASDIFDTIRPYTES